MEEFEDDWTDLVRKANYERQLFPQEISKLISQKDFSTLSRHLKLDAEKLRNFASGKLKSDSVQHSKLKRIIAPFGKYTVNLWLLQTEHHHLLVDTGTRSKEVSDLITAGELTKNTKVLITHLDDDHTGGNQELESRLSTSINFPFSDKVICETISTPGHREEHFAYYFPEQQICFCGDALFSCSIGRPNFSLRQARASLEKLLQLPAETILCSGHGPASTVDFEHQHNPFSVR